MAWVKAILLVDAENEQDAISEARSWIGNAFIDDETGPFDTIDPTGAEPASRGMVAKAKKEEAENLAKGWETVVKMAQEYPCLPANPAGTPEIRRGLLAAREIENLANHWGYREVGDKGVMCRMARLYGARLDKDGPENADGVWAVSLDMHY